jgi:hypothetical protein
VWLSADDAMPAGLKRISTTEKRILIISWGRHNIVQVSWPTEEMRLNVPLSLDETLTPISKKLHATPAKPSRPWTIAHMDKTRVHNASTVTGMNPDLGTKPTCQPADRPAKCPSDMSPLWLTKRKVQNVNTVTGTRSSKQLMKSWTPHRFQELNTFPKPDSPTGASDQLPWGLRLVNNFRH